MTPGLPRRLPRGAIRCALLGATLAASAGCVHAPAAGYDQASQATETNEMADASSATMECKGMSLDSVFQAGAGQSMRVRLHVHYMRTAVLSVFARTSRLARRSMRQRLAAVQS